MSRYIITYGRKRAVVHLVAEELHRTVVTACGIGTDRRTTSSAEEVAAAKARTLGSYTLDDCKRCAGRQKPRAIILRDNEGRPESMAERVARIQASIPPGILKS